MFYLIIYIYKTYIIYLFDNFNIYIIYIKKNTYISELQIVDKAIKWHEFFGGIMSGKTSND